MALTFKEIHSLNHYINFTKALKTKHMWSKRICPNENIIKYLKSLNEYEVQYFKTYNETGAAFLIIWALLKSDTPPTFNSWSLFLDDILLLLKFWLDTTRDDLIINYYEKNWWQFLKEILLCMQAFCARAWKYSDKFVKLTLECLLQLATNEQLEVKQKNIILKCLNYCASASSQSIRISKCLDHYKYFVMLGKYMSSCSDMDTQLTVMECLLRFLVNRSDPARRVQVADIWFPKPYYTNSVRDIFLKKQFVAPLQDIKEFVMAHNSIKNLIYSVECTAFTFGTICIDSNSLLNFNKELHSVTVSLNTDMLHHLSVTEAVVPDLLNITNDNTNNVVFDTESNLITINVIEVDFLYESTILKLGHIKCIQIKIANKSDTSYVDKELQQVFHEKYQRFYNRVSNVNETTRNTISNSEDDTNFMPKFSFSRRSGFASISTSRQNLDEASSRQNLGKSFFSAALNNIQDASKSKADRCPGDTFATGLKKSIAKGEIINKAKPCKVVSDSHSSDEAAENSYHMSFVSVRRKNNQNYINDNSLEFTKKYIDQMNASLSEFDQSHDSANIEVIENSNKTTHIMPNLMDPDSMNNIIQPKNVTQVDNETANYDNDFLKPRPKKNKKKKKDIAVENDLNIISVYEEEEPQINIIKTHQINKNKKTKKKSKKKPCSDIENEITVYEDIEKPNLQLSNISKNNEIFEGLTSKDEKVIDSNYNNIKKRSQNTSKFNKSDMQQESTIINEEVFNDLLDNNSKQSTTKSQNKISPTQYEITILNENVNNINEKENNLNDYNSNKQISSKNISLKNKSQLQLEITIINEKENNLNDNNSKKKTSNKVKSLKNKSQIQDEITIINEEENHLNNKYTKKRASSTNTLKSRRNMTHKDLNSKFVKEEEIVNLDIFKHNNSTNHTSKPQRNETGQDQTTIINKEEHNLNYDNSKIHTPGTHKSSKIITQDGEKINNINISKHNSTNHRPSTVMTNKSKQNQNTMINEEENNLNYNDGKKHTRKTQNTEEIINLNISKYNSKNHRSRNKTVQDQNTIINEEMINDYGNSHTPGSKEYKCQRNKTDQNIIIYEKESNNFLDNDQEVKLNKSKTSPVTYTPIKINKSVTKRQSSIQQTKECINLDDLITSKNDKTEEIGRKRKLYSLTNESELDVIENLDQNVKQKNDYYNEICEERKRFKNRIRRPRTIFAEPPTNKATKYDTIFDTLRESLSHSEINYAKNNRDIAIYNYTSDEDDFEPNLTKKGNKKKKVTIKDRKKTKNITKKVAKNAKSMVLRDERMRKNTRKEDNLDTSIELIADHDKPLPEPIPRQHLYPIVTIENMDFDITKAINAKNIEKDKSSSPLPDLIIGTVNEERSNNSIEILNSRRDKRKISATENAEPILVDINSPSNISLCSVVNNDGIIIDNAEPILIDINSPSNITLSPVGGDYINFANATNSASNLSFGTLETNNDINTDIALNVVNSSANVIQESAAEFRGKRKFLSKSLDDCIKRKRRLRLSDLMGEVIKAGNRLNNGNNESRMLIDVVNTITEKTKKTTREDRKQEVKDAIRTTLSNSLEELDKSLQNLSVNVKKHIEAIHENIKHRITMIEQDFAESLQIQTEIIHQHLNEVLQDVIAKNT